MPTFLGPEEVLPVHSLGEDFGYGWEFLMPFKELVSVPSIF